MTNFNAFQPKQNSKANLVEAWGVACDENKKLNDRIKELEQAVNFVNFTFKHNVSGEVKTVSLSNSEVQEALESDAFDRIDICDCQPVGETNVIECDCPDYMEGFELQQANQLKE